MHTLLRKLSYSLFYIIVAVYVIQFGITDLIFFVKQESIKTSNDKTEEIDYKSKEAVKQENAGYNTKIKGTDQFRLGFSLQPEFQVFPKNSREILKELQSQWSALPTNNPLFLIKPIKVLVFRDPWWGNFADCPEIKDSIFKCEFTVFPESSNISLFNDTLLSDDFDAVFAYRSHQYREPFSLDFVYTIIKEARPTRQNKMPKLVYFTQESPMAPHGFQMQFKSQYYDNYDVSGERRAYFGSYWRGSDMYRPYNQWVYFNSSVRSKPQEVGNYAEGRTKMAAIVVSNCQPNNNRLGFVKELQQYISVDIFGKCGDFECTNDTCFEQLFTHYKFYLAFENSNCRDYITEKLFSNAYDNALVPIVLGAHPVDYRAIAPEKSYIHVEDFDSIEELGKYLQILDKNDTLYNEYFTWKGTGYFPPQENYLCSVCARLHANRFRKVLKSFSIPLKEVTKLNKYPLPYFNDVDTYNFDVFNWTFEDGRLCLKTNKWYWDK